MTVAGGWAAIALSSQPCIPISFTCRREHRGVQRPLSITCSFASAQLNSDKATVEDRTHPAASSRLLVCARARSDSFAGYSRLRGCGEFCGRGTPLPVFKGSLDVSGHRPLYPLWAPGWRPSPTLLVGPCKALSVQYKEYEPRVWLGVQALVRLASGVLGLASPLSARLLAPGGMTATAGAMAIRNSNPLANTSRCPGL